MNDDISQIAQMFRGRFLESPESLRQKVIRIRAIVFDWDGVFNGGIKDESGSSTFSEIDAMGTNLLRFSHFIATNQSLFTAIISGEKNPLAFKFAKREHFHEVYFKIRHKSEAVLHFCRRNEIDPQEVAFVFDDVLDFSAARICGLRVMVGRTVNPFLTAYATQKGLADYITSVDGGSHAVREAVELMMAIRGNIMDTIEKRTEFGETYQRYWQFRNAIDPAFYTTEDYINFQLTPQ